MNDIPSVMHEMRRVDFWISQLQSADDILVNDCEREALAQEWMTANPSLIDLEQFLYGFDQRQLQEDVLAASELSGAFYDENGSLLPSSYWDAMRFACNLTSLQKTEIRYALTVRRAAVRRLPTLSGAFRKGDAPHFDRLQETAFHMWEPLVVLHESMDGAFYLVQATTYRGWVASIDLAFTDRETWNHYRNWLKADFLLLTGNTVTLLVADNPEPFIAEYAARLPLCTVLEEGTGHAVFVVEVPGRTSTGAFFARKASVLETQTVHRGHLPCTRRNLLLQAFALVGEPYGWGDEQGLHDCSSFVMDVYRTVGIDLPRNTGDQEALSGVRKSIFPDYSSSEERNRLLAEYLPGDLLYMPGHTMFYLGKWGADPYILHDFSGFARYQEDGQWVRVPVMRVDVSPLSLALSENGTYLTALTSAIAIAI